MAAVRSASAPESFDLSGWVDEVERVDRAGDVYVRLRKGRQSLILQLSAPGAHRQVLARTRYGDVSYNEVVGLSEAAAAQAARVYAARLETGTSPVSMRLPHLAVASASDRPTGSCRSALTALWRHATPLPAPCDRVRLDPAGLADFLAPELGPDATPFAGFVLRSIGVATADGVPECILEFESGADAPPVSEPVRIAVSPSSSEGGSFGARQVLSLAVRRGGVDRRGDLLPEVARCCSLLAALIELKQSAAFAVEVPDQGPMAAAVTAVEGSPPAAGATPFDAEMHRFSIISSGYTILRGVLPASELGEITAAVDRALAAMCTAAEAGRDLAYTFYDRETYLGTRCIYCWGDACVRLIENDIVRRIAEAVIGPHKLFDMSAHRALPAAHLRPERTEEWHRDIDVFEDSSPRVSYLWFFIPLDDFNADNGATWIVPGSQRMPNIAVPPKGSTGGRFPTRVQLTGSAGDLFVINPSTLHTVGHNATPRARTMINLGVCHSTVRPLLDHWSIAGPSLQARASDRLRTMLGAAGEAPLDTTWSVLPDGWQTARRPVETDPSTRVFPPEQQGYQRSHRIRDDD